MDRATKLIVGAIVVLVIALGLLLNHAAGVARANLSQQEQTLPNPLAAFNITQCDGSVDLITVFPDGSVIEFRPQDTIVSGPGRQEVHRPPVHYDTAIMLAGKAAVTRTIITTCGVAELPFHHDEPRGEPDQTA